MIKWISIYLLSILIPLILLLIIVIQTKEQPQCPPNYSKRVFQSGNFYCFDPVEINNNRNNPSGYDPKVLPQSKHKET